MNNALKKIFFCLCCLILLINCTDHNEPKITTANFLIKNNSNYTVKLKWKTIYSDASNNKVTKYDSLEIVQGSNTSFERKAEGIPFPFENADSLIVSFDNTKSNHYRYVDLVSGNLLRYENYNAKIISEFTHDYTYTITDLDYDYGN